MAFPVVTPAYFKELVDVTGPAEKYQDFTEIIVSPAAVEYVLHLKNPDVVRKLMSITDSIEFKMASMDDSDSEEFIKQSQAAIANNPCAEYYWQLRTLMMSVIQNKNVTLEKRVLLLNYAIKGVQRMFDNHQPTEIPKFIAAFCQETDYSKTLEYFKSISPDFRYALTDGISLLKSLTKDTPEYKEVMNTIYKNLGVSGPETLGLVDMNKYIELRKAFSVEFMAEHSHWIENIMVNFIWTYSMPFASSSKLDVWENYVFFCAIYNAVKILVTCYMPGKSDEDFVKAISAFDDALSRTGSDTVWKIVAAIKNLGQSNNGDMAILTIS